ncbi:hypothetical protein PLICRDRAFT_56067 [Plicaturopsis crispa FD-325 SS-3]|nr:hypothetical protein PLICRDRAFT_56067 [Plicaturopsis crispa FD-325 SS-3]
MESSLRIVPSNTAKSTSIKDTAGSLGVHDTLAHGPRSIAAEVSSTSSSTGALKQRLQSWEETQDNLKLTLQRNIYGMHAPVRLLMERKIVSQNPHMPAMPGYGSNLQLDILMGRDELIEPVDVFGGPEQGPPLDIHKDMEKKLRM